MGSWCMTGASKCYHNANINNDNRAGVSFKTHTSQIYQNAGCLENTWYSYFFQIIPSSHSTATAFSSVWKFHTLSNQNSPAYNLIFYHFVTDLFFVCLFWNAHFLNFLYKGSTGNIYAAFTNKAFLMLNSLRVCTVTPCNRERLKDVIWKGLKRISDVAMKTRRSSPI